MDTKEGIGEAATKGTVTTKKKGKYLHISYSSLVNWVAK